jgi:hypothetical protein
MKAAFRFLLVISAALLLGFAVRDTVSWGWRISTAASYAPGQAWDTLADAVAWGKQYKEGATVVFIVCLVAVFISRTPAIRK